MHRNSYRTAVLIVALCTAFPFAVEGSGAVRGRIVDAVSGVPVAGAAVRIAGVGRATTDAAGRFRLQPRRAVSGPRRVVIRVAGYWRRATWFDLDTPGRPTWSIIPRDSSFDMEIFDTVARGNGITSRWLDEPTFRILETRMACEEIVAFVCQRWVATDRSMSPGLANLLDELVALAPALTGGFVATPKVERVRLSAGARYTPDELAEPGVILLGEQTGADLLEDYFPGRPRAEPIDRAVYLSFDHSGTGISRAFHLFRHALGYAQSPDAATCLDLLAADGPLTIHCESHPFGPATPLDVAMGRVLYDRPIGNRYPDKDPQPQS